MTTRHTLARDYDPSADFERRADGSVIVTPRFGLGAYPDRYTQPLEHFAATTPDAVMIGQRGPDGSLRTITYAQAMGRVRAIAQFLLGQNLSADRPVVILSGPDIEHALLGFACMHIGVPYAPLSVPYSLASEDFGKLRFIFQKLTPGLVFAADGAQFARALNVVATRDMTVVVTGNPPLGRDALLFGDVAASVPTSAVAEAAATVTPDTVAKFLFTSGTTGSPKGVITTHRMLCSNAKMIRTTLPGDPTEPPVLVDWLPWNHVFGGSHNTGFVWHAGGSYYIDAGRPVPGGMAETIRNLRDIAPTAYLTVPKGWEELAIALRDDPDLRKTFFSRMRFFFYAAASLSQPVWDELDRLSREELGERMEMITGLGATETAPLMTVTLPGLASAGMIGLPAPSCTLKIAPAGDKLEIRAKGPNITPGYWREPELTTKAFDEEGYYRLGDAVTWLDPYDYQKGLRFNGRIAEDFKLATGVWVNVGRVRETAIKALHPYVNDVVITGHDLDYIGGLAIPSSPPVVTDTAIHAEIVSRLREVASHAEGSSARIARLTFLTGPLSMDAGEVTDKGSLNQRQLIKTRAELVQTLYVDPPPPGVLVVGKGK